MVDNFCEKITDEVNEASTVQRKRLTAETMVERYGSQGYIDFIQFKEIYKNHVHFADDLTAMKPLPDDAKLESLFTIFDPDQRNPKRVSAAVFGKQVRAKAP